MAATKKPVAKPARPTPAPKKKAAAKAAAKVAAPAPAAPQAAAEIASAAAPGVSAPQKAPKAPKPDKPPKPDSGKRKDSKKKSGKKEKKMNDGDNAAGNKKMVRDSFTMPAPDYALIAVLKERTLSSGTAVKKSELLRAGLVALAALSPAQLIDLVSSMPAIKTGRPGKKKK